jgi:hypothetical protein
MKPPRKIITRSPHRSVGAVHEPWFQSEPIQHESRLEKHCIEILLLTPSVVRIESQPLTIEFGQAKKPRHYTPDLRITLSDGTQALVEPKGQPYEKRFRELLDSGLRDALRSFGLPLYLVPSQLLDPERTAQVSTLRAMARRAPPAGAIDALLAWMAQQTTATVGDAEQAGHPLGHIGHAIGRRLLTVGPSFELAPQQPLFLTSSYEHLHPEHWLGYPGRAEDVAA